MNFKLYDKVKSKYGDFKGVIDTITVYNQIRIARTDTKGYHWVNPHQIIIDDQSVQVIEEKE